MILFNNIHIKILSFILVIVITITYNVSVLAMEYDVRSQIDLYQYDANYVEKLDILNENEIENLKTTEANELFEEAFNISSKYFTEKEVRLAIEEWSSVIKLNSLSKTQKSTSTYLKTASTSTKGNKTYTGNVGLAWIRDTTSKGSPLSLGEIISGCYTIEVDYLPWETVATILAAASKETVFDRLKVWALGGVSSTLLTTLVCTSLGITGAPATITAVIVSAVVSIGWGLLKQLDKNRMSDAFNKMKKNEWLRADFMTYDHQIYRHYKSYKPVSHVFKNPFNQYGKWYSNDYGIKYSY